MRSPILIALVLAVGLCGRLAGQGGGQTAEAGKPSREDATASRDPQFAKALEQAYQSAGAAFMSGKNVKTASQADQLRALAAKPAEPTQAPDAGGMPSSAWKEAAVKRYEEALDGADAIQAAGWFGQQKESELRQFAKRVEAAAKGLKMDEKDQQYAVYYYMARQNTGKPLPPDQYWQKQAEAYSKPKLSRGQAKSVNGNALEMAQALGGLHFQSGEERMANDPTMRLTTTIKNYNVGNGKITTVTETQYVQIDPATGKIVRYGGIESSHAETFNAGEFARHKRLDETIVPPPGTVPMGVSSNIVGEEYGSPQHYSPQLVGRNGESEFQRKQREAEERDRIAEQEYRKSTVGQADTFYSRNCHDKSNGMLARGASCAESFGLHAVGLPSVLKSGNRFGAVVSNDDVSTGEKLKRGGKFAGLTVITGVTAGTAVGGTVAKGVKTAGEVAEAAQVTEEGVQAARGAKAAQTGIEAAETGSKVAEAGVEAEKATSLAKKVKTVVRVAKEHPAEFAENVTKKVGASELKHHGKHLAKDALLDDADGGQ